MRVGDRAPAGERCDPRTLRIVPDIPRVVYLIPVMAVLVAIVLFASVMHHPVDTDVPSPRGAPSSGP